MGRAGKGKVTGRGRAELSMRKRGSEASETEKGLER